MPSSSKSRVLNTSSGPTGEAEAFAYQPATGGNGGQGTAGAAPAPLTWVASGTSSLRRYSEQDLQAQKKQALEQGRREGEANFEKTLAAERARVAQALEAFAAERKSYFEKVEIEVVQLALLIARKILHREAQVDPLLLSGVVRVALEKVGAGSSVKLRVPESEMFKWRQVISAVKNLHPMPEVIGDASLGLAQCILETEVGSTNLSLDAQFKEVERGLLDLLALRPGS